ncbi:flagellar protein FlaG [Vibrio parahaemolyticus]|uniref:flagellar protein FlaG n=1 Tax=Vibrio parahaemolyticus TaxID=670 RepID=UPI000D73023B|nr:flagellar protein FlaG [Vibrio parahaemolyticus]MCR9646780.1 flagellar protein FlaG [Vibrio parahaemolyticus]MCR9801160.1 flagellar protein FlaG [Vibrio parahaemolyticus]MDF4283016.1 flagellar protein FlaG [Vibrio parahaemolyticus]MDF4314247.1 flagellar protein FlaG [Vibrio parahaemolyticus]MDF4964451.1 flagellar protein FlaG [Vibrio parahaemolyticus]
MEISSYASNIQPYGTPNGTNVANKNGNSIGTPSTASSTGDVSPQKAKGTEHDFSVQAAIEMAESRQELNREEREKMVEQMNEFVSSINKGVAFRVDEESGRDVVTIYETNTGDVIRQFPDEELLVVLRRLAEHTANSGLLVEKV